LKVLPYANTKPNREKGNRWIHVAPSVTRDVKEWFEGAKWAKPEDWPHRAKLLWDFFKKVLGDTSLEDACNAFSESPYSTGLQTGMLSPFLNAVDPDRFVIINNKSRRIVNSFKAEGINFRQALVDYPKTNETAWQFIKLMRDKIEKTEIEYEHISDVFDMFCHWIVAEKKYFKKSAEDEPVDSKTRYWKVAPGESARKWDECREGGYIAIGWGLVGDLGEYQTRKELREKVEEIRKDQPSWKLGAVRQLWQFGKQIKQGDKIIANRGFTEVVGIGTVVGEYEFDDMLEYPHIIPVEWEDTNVREFDMKGWRSTVIETDETTYHEILGKKPPPPGPVDEPILKDVEDILRRKGQVILYGPPGTGKTYTARRFGVYWLLKDAGREDINEVLSDSEQFIQEEQSLSSAQVSKRVWWLVANPKEWQWETLFKKKKETFRYGRLQRNYPLVKRGDLVIGYESTPAKQLKAIARITREFGVLDGDEQPTIQIEPVARITKGLTYEELQADPVLKESEPLKFNNQGTLFGLTTDQAGYLLSLLSDRDPSLSQYIEWDQGISSLTRLTFHPSYTYEDFIEGFKPVDSMSGSLQLRLEDGVFKKICRQAQSQPEKKFLVLIDEINRANIAKVFGELVTLLENDKRDLVVTLPQSKESFCIPSNVYILGTMNTADRSIKLLDAALRRRFAFVELMPDTGLLKNAMVGSLPLDKFLDELNYRIAKNIGREKQIGHSFFLDEEGLAITDPDEFARRFRQEILPLLQEYCYEDYATLATYIGDSLVDKHKQMIVKDLLLDSEKLIKALSDELINGETAAE
jgi:5-methylcytosine-specific restriction protein B